MALGIKCGRVAQHKRWVHQQQQEQQHEGEQEQEEQEETGFELITVQLGHCGGACTHSKQIYQNDQNDLSDYSLVTHAVTKDS